MRDCVVQMHPPQSLSNLGYVPRRDMNEIGADNEMKGVRLEFRVLVFERARGVEDEWRRDVGALEGGNVGGNGGEQSRFELSRLPT